jgi:two-component system, NtrC family, sensor kinase
MKRICILLISTLFSLVHADSQTNLPPTYEVHTDTAFSYILPDSCVRILADKNNQWSGRDMVALADKGEFHEYSPEMKRNDTPIYTYWFLYLLKNTMMTGAKISLNSVSDYDDFYVESVGAAPLHYSTGNFSDIKDGLKWINCIPILLKPNETITVYQRIKNIHKGLPNRFNIAILGTEKAIQNGYVRNTDSGFTIYSMLDLQAAFMIGLLLLAVFFSLFFYSVTREKMYIYFSLFALFLGINRLYDVAYDYFSINKPSWLSYLPFLLFAWAFIHFFLLQFIRQFFDVKRKYKRWDALLLFLALLTICMHGIRLIGGLITGDFASTWSAFFSPLFQIIPLAIIITFLVFIREKNRAYRFLIVGAFPLMFWYFLTGFSLAPFEVFAVFKKLDAIFRPVELSCTVWLVLFFSWTLFMRYNKLRKENAQKDLEKERLAKEKEIERSQLIEDQKIELEKTVETRTAELKQSLENLQSTQSQLIQSEKMASLGELTAGIAHEIQNPLNFVNNFSEVNNELLLELKNEIDNGNVNDAKAIAEDILVNSQKIFNHGKRADAIVKSMMQHSQSSASQKELTDLNALAEEYLRLSYHGIRAKDKLFDATLNTDFDRSIGKINVIPQDIGRVLLNLYNNAFYALAEKKKQHSDGYLPFVSVSTKKVGDKAELRVKDNGPGIPSKALDKIFQPFFTTKPTGQGTGLGLSLSYDIVKAYGGEIKVTTVEGAFTEFVMLLPIV